MKKSKLFSLMAMVLAALMVLAACTPAANNDAPADAGKSEAQTPVQSDKNEKTDAPDYIRAHQPDGLERFGQADGSQFS